MKKWWVAFIIILTILAVSCNRSEAVSGKAYNDLSSEQKQAYWSCFKDPVKNCQDLLLKKDPTYRQCSLDCFNKAKIITPQQAWCKDSDNGDNFLEKGIVTTNIYQQGKEDSCHTFPDGKNYLFEGRCKDNKYQYLQKNCAELGEDYYCSEGLCKTDVTYDGDGNYLVKKGDIIKSNNGIKLTVVDIVSYDNTTNDFAAYNLQYYKDPSNNLVKGNYVILLNYANGNEPLNVVPLVGACKEYDPKTNEHCYLIDDMWKLISTGIKVSFNYDVINEDSILKANMTLKTVNPKKNPSCQESYDICMKKWNNNWECRGGCPQTSHSGEGKIENENYLVIYPLGMEEIAKNVFAQMQQCNSFYDSEGVSKNPWISRYAIRIVNATEYGPGHTYTDDGIIMASSTILADKEDLNPYKWLNNNPSLCGNEIIAHELVHYRNHYTNEFGPLGEGLATFLAEPSTTLSVQCGTSSYSKPWCSLEWNCGKQCGVSYLKTYINLTNGQTINYKSHTLSILISDIIGFNTSINVNPLSPFLQQFPSSMGDPLISLIVDDSTTYTFTHRTLLSKNQSDNFIPLDKETGLLFTDIQYNFTSGKHILTFQELVLGSPVAFSSSCINEKCTMCHNTPIAYENLTTAISGAANYNTQNCFFRNMESTYGPGVIKNYFAAIESSAEKFVPFCINDFLKQQGTEDQAQQLLNTFGLTTQPCGKYPIYPK